MWSTRSNSLLIACLFTLVLSAQERIRFMCYNVENFFDCVDDTLTADDAFLPEATRHWTPYRYWEKLQAVSRVIASAGIDRAPDFVALCEVENDSVMYDLTRRSSLRTAKYNYFITSSDDPRGIDVALMYKPSTFRPFAHRALRLPEEELSASYMRDILLVSGELYTGDTLDIFVCHLPSRLRGKKSALLRYSIAKHICEVVDSLNHRRLLPNIIVMGDFNDTYHSTALLPFTEQQLTCITSGLSGSYRYKGKWEQIDHIYLSPSLLHTTDSNTLHLTSQGANIFAPAFLLEPEPRYGGHKPFRTYNGMRYQGGTSDHLPVYFDLERSTY